MRITDHRYLRDLRRYNLALRLIGYEARTRTISSWTGLSDERVRNLCQSYVKAERPVSRHRGPSPNRPGFFLRSARIRNEAAALGGLFRMLDITSGATLTNVRRDLPTVARGERLCTAYDLFRGFVPDSVISIEHAIMLAMSLVQGNELKLSNCTLCDCLVLTESYGASSYNCIYCLKNARGKKNESLAV